MFNDKCLLTPARLNHNGHVSGGVCVVLLIDKDMCPALLRRNGADTFQIIMPACFSLCGYPPFQGKAEAAISPWMKAMGHHSQYEFSDPEWSRVSSEGEFIYTFSRVFQAVKVVKHHSI